jgi:uncharacterized protein YdhG (YjbR/CyaY superfamily)
MARAASVDAYIAQFPAPVQRVLKQLRRTLRQALPGAEEVISYSIPAYKLHGRIVIYFAGWKAHYSIYPATAPLIAAFKTQLEPYEYNNKGTIRFPLTEPVPVSLITKLARFRARQIKPKTPKPKTSKPKL